MKQSELVCHCIDYPLWLFCNVIDQSFGVQLVTYGLTPCLCMDPAFRTTDPCTRVMIDD